ncbi:hypothetical protein ACWC9T_39205 [Kitasatospora sp. NPDC001159]
MASSLVRAMVVVVPGVGVERVREARAEDPARVCVVVTADRELRSRVDALGAAVTGPRSVRG